MAAAPVRVLLVEDHNTNRLLFQDFLQQCGYEVSSLANGEHFFSALIQFKPHLILLDLKLPQVDGFTLLTQLRQSSQWQQIPVIVVSACVFDADQKQALKLGANRFMAKPVGLKELRQAIETELQHCTTQTTC